MKPSIEYSPCSKFKNSVHANSGHYISTYYCYDDTCPGRTKKEPWPHSDGYLRNKKFYCKYCNKRMTGTFSADDFA